MSYVRARTALEWEEEDIMQSSVKLATAVLIGISLTGVAQGQPKLNCTKDVQYSKEFLTKFPDAGAACQEVKVVQGEKWVRFNAQVKYNKDNRLTVNFLNTNGDHTGNPVTFAYTPDATLTLEKKKVVKTASEVKDGDIVIVWVPESRFGVFAEPGAAESKQFKVVSDDSTK
jgi:hypothetical protein